ncbi:adenylyltransferase/cytidyltransferase family protein [Nocardioides donggukensis]|uniref:FAD synthase n=1 Tax=Nocardioides donggukensis TaxID=2774019 RepID=A0A927K529_9ACTN|nr:adenylyltransferase/cytidyltransferase family protein [Nocardioides donggukensis]MBD8868016.1 adenylyltransferase/cytidyltransferase family protein [Nocardioides donggukensis]
MTRTTSLAPHLTTWPQLGQLVNGSVVTMGVFDGFHRGHQILARRACDRAHELLIPSVLLTFDPHPLLLTRPERAPRQLMTVTERVETALALGIDHVIVLPFDRQMASTSAESFVSDGLVQRLGARHVVVGVNFRFGRGGTGDTDYLQEAGHWHGFDVDPVPLVEHRGRVCSSTNVRGLLAGGDLTAARGLLGRSADRVLGPRSIAATA